MVDIYVWGALVQYVETRNKGLHIAWMHDVGDLHSASMHYFILHGCTKEKKLLACARLLPSLLLLLPEHVGRFDFLWYGERARPPVIPAARQSE